MKYPAWLFSSRTQWLGFILGALIVGIGTLTPLSQLADAPGSDKTHHIIGFGGWALLCALGHARRFYWMALSIALMGGVIELIQPYVNRYGEWNDFWADLFGVLLAILIRRLIRPYLLRGTDTA